MHSESAQSLLTSFGIAESHTSPSLQSLSKNDSRYLRDLKLNVSTLLGAKNLTKKEAALIALSIAINEKNAALIDAFEKLAEKEGATTDEISETHGCVSIMSVNNVFYRFRHFMAGTEYYEKTPAGLRMSIMMNPVMGKPLFELISLVVSAVNGCEQCVKSHEHSVKELGADEARIYDAVRLGAVIRGLSVTI
jgi:alkyl hydroperoxide reductase subunit D